MQIEIRKFIQSDKNDCIRAFKTNVPDFFTELEINDFTDFLDKVDEITAESETPYYVVTLDQKIIGCGGIGCYLQKNEASLCWGLIERSFHKKGYGEIFLKYRLDQIAELYPTAQINIDTTQFTAPFFAKFGFKIVKITKDFYAQGMDRYDMIFEGDLPKT